MAAETSISVTFAARTALRKYRAAVGGALGASVRLPDALQIALIIAAQHPEQIAAAAAELGIDPEE